MGDEAGEAATISSQSQPSTSPLGHSVIPIVNKLQDIFAQLGSSSTIELPQVAVVGSQSSGKSSVLEALVGRDFLPRGSDICTRRPLVLQLLQTKRKPDGTGEEYGEFLHLKNKKFYDFAEIRREIQAETDREAGGNKGVSDKQIRLKIYSPNVLDITLVDLPGITKVPVGDQPSDIEARIRTMILSYIKHPSCLILAVTPANANLVNSDALQIAGAADPDGYRTIGVITKLDIMDRGTDASNFLLGKVIPLRLGYVGVVNRSQQDINYNRSIKDALANEEKFFRNQPVYNGLSDRCGVPQLAKKLNQILVQHIRTVLPGLKSHIRSALVSVAKEHASYGEITESKAGQGALLLNILTKYAEASSSMVEGKNEAMSTSELSGGARIHYIFQSIFGKSLEEVDPCCDLTDDDIRTAIQNATGPKSALFVPEVPFEVLIRRQITRLLDPSLQCARFIYDELIKRFSFLRRRMDEVIGNFLREGLEPSETMIGHIIEMEAGQGALLLNILTKYAEAFSSMVEGKNEAMSTSELSGGARIHYIFQSIFGKSLEEVDPCDDLTDDDIRTAIQNATGPKSALFVPEVPFEVLIRRQIARLLDPSLQCARFIYDELIKISHRCLSIEMQRFPFLRRRMDEVIGNFLREGLEPSETMIGHIIEMEMDYINTSHPNFIGGSKAVEVALQQIKSSRLSRPNVGIETEKVPGSEKSVKSRAILARSPANGIGPDQGVRSAADAERPGSSGTTNTSSSIWGISSIFGGNESRAPAKENTPSKFYNEPVQSMEYALSSITLREPPTILKPSETHSEQEMVEISVTKLLLKSYYDIVRKNVEDSVPKAIMHFLVNHTKRELHNVFIKKLYRDNLFEEMLQEPDEVAMKRKRTRETLRVLQQAFRTLDELPLEADTVEKGYSLGNDPTGLPKVHGLPTSSMYTTSGGSDFYAASPKNPKSRKSSHSGELNSPLHAYADSNGSTRHGSVGSYPTVEI